MFGIQESVYHNVPMVILPIFGDQFDNAVRVEEKMLGVAIWDKHNVTPDILREKMGRVLQDSRYNLARE